jgi:hypothetical protein
MSFLSKIKFAFLTYENEARLFQQQQQQQQSQSLKPQACTFTEFEHTGNVNNASTFSEKNGNELSLVMSQEAKRRGEREAPDRIEEESW